MAFAFGPAGCVVIEFGIIANQTGDPIQVRYAVRSWSSETGSPDQCDFAPDFGPVRISGGRRNYKKSENWAKIDDSKYDESTCEVTFWLNSDDAVIVNEGGLCSRHASNADTSQDSYNGRIEFIEIVKPAEKITVSGWDVPKQFVEWKTFCVWDVE